MSEASFDPLARRDADDDFNAAGTWRLARDDQEIALYFSTAIRGEGAVETGGFVVPFRSGTIRFSDPDETVDIEFRLESNSDD